MNRSFTQLEVSLSCCSPIIATWMSVQALLVLSGPTVADKSMRLIQLPCRTAPWLVVRSETLHSKMRRLTNRQDQGCLISRLAIGIMLTGRRLPTTKVERDSNLQVQTRFVSEEIDRQSEPTDDLHPGQTSELRSDHQSQFLNNSSIASRTTKSAWTSQRHQK